MDPFVLTEGTAPLLVSMPHVATHVPADMFARMTGPARLLPDTDWHVDRLYGVAPALGASVLRATHSRVVIDLNRDPEGAPLYPGADNTELVPTSLFDRTPIWREGAAPDAAEIADRRARFWEPYHDALAGELARIKARFGYALLYDAHSIRSHVPRFFQGRLPDFNIGTGGGTTADPALTEAIARICRAAPGYTTAVNGRFKGGTITRRYGRPAEGVHAVQMELAQATYMEEAPPFAYDEAKAAAIAPILRAVLEAMIRWAPAG
jgi:N-formylglutamate deformylase